MSRKIYFYSTQAHYEDQLTLGRTPRLKIGDTEQSDVVIRIEEQDGTGHPEPLELKYACNVDFRDKKFHRHLIRKGYQECRLDKKREWFYITVEDAMKELEEYSNKDPHFFKRTFVPRSPQLEVTDKILSRWNGETIVQPLDLCPRFGKTLFGLHLFNELGFDNLITASYVLTANESFVEEIEKKFDITSDITVIPPSYDEYVKVGGRRMIDVSLHANEVDERLISELSGSNSLIIVDEADFGSWTSKSREVLNQFIQAGNNVVLLATGTNIEKAMIGAHNALTPIKFSYLNLIERKRSGDPTLQDIVEVSTLTLDASPSWIESMGELDDDKRPNMLKLLSRSNSHTTREVLNQLFSQDHPNNVLNLYEGEFGGVEKPVIMMFIGGTKKDVDTIVKNGSTILPEFEWMSLHGDVTTNRKATKETQSRLDNMKGKNALIIVSCQMGSRSYSIPNCNIVIIAKDGGSSASALQQASRCLTPSGDKKNGLIIEYGFDVDRVSSVEAELIRSLLDTESEESTESQMRRVHKLVNMMRMDEFGYPTTLKEVDFLKFVTSPKNIQAMAVTTVNYDTLLTVENISEILEGVNQFKGATRQDRNLIGRAQSYIQTQRGSNQEPDMKSKVMKDLVNKITTIVKTVGNVHVLSPQSSDYMTAINNVANNSTKDDSYSHLVGIPTQAVIDYVVPHLSVDLMDMIIIQAQNGEVGQFTSNTGDNSGAPLSRDRIIIK
jgi:hypothetical protein